MNKSTFFYILIVCASLFSACRKNDKIDYDPNLRLNFSTDSILFDTVFTDRGTTTRVIKVFNYNKNSILINELKLSDGDQSSFKININGLSASTVKNFEIKGNDSMYVFVKAFIDPTNRDTPFLVEDSLFFNFNGKKHKIPLVAYGQNAIYLNNENINTHTTFTKNKPYIIYNGVSVDENIILNIDAGAKLFFHKNAKLTVNGSLKAIGTALDTITFAGDRLERIYRDEPGQWEGIYFSATSKDNELNHCIIKNAITGIRIDSLSVNNNTKLLLTNSIIKNHTISGLIGYNGSLTGINNLFFNCGQYLLAILNGGEYDFMQNTFAGYNQSFSRVTPAVYIADNSIHVPGVFDLSANFTNNIIWGTLKNELEIQQSGQKLFDYVFNNNVIKGDIRNLGGTNNLFNIDPLFMNTRFGNYQLRPESTLNGLGLDLNSNVHSVILSTDLNNSVRSYPSTLGCYEKY